MSSKIIPDNSKQNVGRSFRSRLPFLIVLSVLVLFILFLIVFATGGSKNGLVPHRATLKELKMIDSIRQEMVDSGIPEAISNDEFFSQANMNATIKKKLQCLPAQQDTLGRWIPLDSWGNPIRYIHGKKGPAFQSSGPDRKFDTADDLFSTDL